MQTKQEVSQIPPEEDLCSAAAEYSSACLSVGIFSMVLVLSLVSVCWGRGFWDLQVLFCLTPEGDLFISVCIQWLLCWLIFVFLFLVFSAVRWAGWTMQSFMASFTAVCRLVGLKKFQVDLRSPVKVENQHFRQCRLFLWVAMRLVFDSCSSSLYLVAES